LPTTLEAIGYPNQIILLMCLHFGGAQPLYRSRATPLESRRHDT